MRLKRGLLSNTQIKSMLRLGLLSEKGKKEAKAALLGKYNKSRYI